MPNRNDTRKILIDIIDQALGQLENFDIDYIHPEAFKLIKQKIGEYIVKLISASVSIANSHDTKSLSPSYVRTAASNLLPQKKLKFFGTLGGAFVGAGLSFFFTKISQGSFSILDVLITIGLFIIGTFLITAIAFK